MRKIDSWTFTHFRKLTEEPAISEVRVGMDKCRNTILEAAGFFPRLFWHLCVRN